MEVYILVNDEIALPQDGFKPWVTGRNRGAKLSLIGSKLNNFINPVLGLSYSINF
jgi:hypothetical protein